MNKKIKYKTIGDFVQLTSLDDYDDTDEQDETKQRQWTADNQVETTTEHKGWQGLLFQEGSGIINSQGQKGQRHTGDNREARKTAAR